LILIVDDDPAVLHSLELLLKQSGFSTRGVATPAEARDQLSQSDLELVLQDMNFSRQTTGEEGLGLLNEIKSKRPDLPVILITAWGSIELAVKGMKAGAADFVTKPWQNERVVSSVKTALNLVASGIRNATPACPTRDELDKKYDFNGILGQDPAFLRILDLAGRVASTDASVLITGDSGTGKELLAQAIHSASDRRNKPFVAINCSAMAENLLESELFGHEKGSFTGAERRRIGQFEYANGGTLFLDEVGEIPMSTQIKLLRVLEDGQITRVGANEPIKVNARRAEGDPGCVRDYVYVGDVVRANIGAIDGSIETGEAAMINVCTGESTTTLALAETIKSLNASASEIGFGPRREGDVERSVLDPGNPSPIGEWKSLAEGLALTSEWFKARRS